MLKETHTVDSVFIHDSIFIHEGGDTVVRERWRTCFRDRIVHDTVREHTTDTIIKTETVVEVVEVQKKGSNAGWTVALTLFAVIVIYTLIKQIFNKH